MALAHKELSLSLKLSNMIQNWPNGGVVHGLIF